MAGEAYAPVRDAIVALGEDPRPPGCLKLTARYGWRSCEIPISHVVFAGFPSCEVSGTDSRKRGCEKGFSHQQMVTVLHVGHRRDVYR